MLNKIIGAGAVAGALMGSLWPVSIPGALASHRERPPECKCSARLSYSSPQLSFGSTGLVFIPRVNVDVRLKGEAAGSQHAVSVRYNGSTLYSSDDLAPPDGLNFSGEKTVLSNGTCEGRWNFKGIELDRLALPGINRSLVGEHQQLTGTAQLKTQIVGCGFEEENRQFLFKVREFGNLRVGGWRSVR